MTAGPLLYQQKIPDDITLLDLRDAHHTVDLAEFVDRSEKRSSAAGSLDVTDLLEESWLRWRGADHAHRQSPESHELWSRGRGA